MISGLVLAAGTSSRLGRPKQLLDLGGTPVINHVLSAALRAPLDGVLLVLGHRADEVEAALPADERVRVVRNERYLEGQATSLVAGLEALGAETDAAVILLGDQPGIRSEAIATVVGAHLGGSGPVVQASYGGRRSHPTLLSKAIWAQIEAEATGDQGARSILGRHPEWVVAVEVGGNPPDDIDTEDDYLRIRPAFDTAN